MVPTTDEKSTTRPGDETPMSLSRLNAAPSYQGIRFFGRETGTSGGSLALAERSGDARKGNTAKPEPKTLSIDTKESSDRGFERAVRRLNELR